MEKLEREIEYVGGGVIRAQTATGHPATDTDLLPHCKPICSRAIASLAAGLPSPALSSPSVFCRCTSYYNTASSHARTIQRQSKICGQSFPGEWWRSCSCC